MPRLYLNDKQSAFIQFHYPSRKSLQFPKQITNRDFEPLLSIIQFSVNILADFLASQLAYNKESLLVFQRAIKQQITPWQTKSKKRDCLTFSLTKLFSFDIAGYTCQLLRKVNKQMSCLFFLLSHQNRHTLFNSSKTTCNNIVNRCEALIYF